MKKRFEFSKLVLCLVMATYFAGLIFGMNIIRDIATNNSSYIATALCGLFSYIGAPVAVAIGFFMPTRLRRRMLRKYAARLR